MADPQAALDRALTEENLTLLYQPIHEARSRRIVAAEALMRQRRQNGEIREAGIITAAAEEAPRTDLFALDSWMVRAAYAGAASWGAQGASDVRLNINLSPREFQEGDVLTRLTSLLTSCGVDPTRVNLEITETSSIDDPEELQNLLRELKKLGLALWLDDFGSGHSTITQLLHFPVDGLKIPGEFTKNLERDKKSRAITAALLRLAHESGLHVIAEGVERESQLQFLLEHGCESIQGFLFSRPMPIEELIERLDDTSDED